MEKPTSVVVLLTPGDVEILLESARIMREIAIRAGRAQLSEVVPVGQQNLVIKKRQGDIVVSIKKATA
jgi:hypothetical protein